LLPPYPAPGFPVRSKGPALTIDIERDVPEFGDGDGAIFGLASIDRAWKNAANMRCLRRGLAAPSVALQLGTALALALYIDGRGVH